MSLKPLACQQPSHADHAQLYETLISELSDFAVFLMDPDGCIVTWNPGVQQIFGYAEEEWIGRQADIIFSPEDVANGVPGQELQSARLTGRASDVRWHLRKNGTPIFVDGAMVALHSAEGELLGFSKICRNMTAHMRREEALRESEARFRAVFESAAIGVARVSFQGARWLDVNDAFCDILGYPRGELIGKPWPIFTHPDDIDIDLKSFERMGRGEIDSYNVEKRFIRKDGHLVWARLTLSLVRDAEGQPDFEVCLMEDISRRKKAEEGLRSSNEDLQRFAYMVSHDLQEPLRQVTAFSQLLVRRPTDPEAAEFGAHIVNGAQAMNTLIRDILHAAQPQGELKPECFTVREALREAIDAVQGLLEESGGRVLIQHPLPKMMASKLVVRQVFQNLLSNAIKYRHPERLPEIRIGCERRESAWVFSVADNGQGIAPEYQDHIFKWFSRGPGTSASGSGVGLASSDHMLARIGGRIWFESQLGEGTAFYFSLPLTDEAANC